jgi:predicted transcriptional regulator
MRNDVQLTQGGLQMARCTELQKTVNEIQDTFNVGSIINQALIEILIAKQIITEEEVITFIGEINRQQEFIYEQRSYD